MKDLIKKEEYKYLEPFKDKFKESIRVGTIKGYDRKDLKKIEEIYKENGGKKHYSFSTCNKCAFKIINKMIHFIEAYEDRYYSHKKEEETQDTTTVEEADTEATEDTENESKPNESPKQNNKD